MNDLEKYSKILADANHSMTIMCKQILCVAVADRNCLESLFDLVEDWEKHLRRLTALITTYEELLEKFIIDK